MSRLFLTIVLIAQSLIGSSQCDAEVLFNRTLAVHYTYLPGANGVGMEAGLTGMDSKLNLHMGVMAFLQNRAYMKESPELSRSGRLYSKMGYRLFRSDYNLSIYSNLLIGMDLDRGLITAVGIKLLHPVGRNAISLEPIYILSQNREINLQLAYHFIL